LTIDDDIAALLKQEMRRTGEPLKQALNRALRSGLTLKTTSGKHKRFVVKPIEGLRLPPEWTSGSVQELLDILEGPGAR